MRVLEFEFKADLARPTPSFPNLLCPRYTGGLDIFESFWIIDVIMRVCGRERISMLFDFLDSVLVGFVIDLVEY